MKKLALIGKDLSYSKSREMHSFIAENLKKEIVYDYFSVPYEDFSSTAEFLLNNYDGFNITIPYKQDIIALLDSTVADAATTQSVNTVVCQNKTGYNTDGEGFMLMLETEGVELNGKRVLVLGAGGAAKSCVYKIVQAGGDTYVYNRTYEKVRQLNSLYGGFTPLKNLNGEKYDIIINTTSVGMTALEGVMPIDCSYIDGASVLVDLIYNPARTAFLKYGESRGKKVVNGEKMLFFQAYYAQTLYFSIQADRQTAQSLFDKFKKEGNL